MSRVTLTDGGGRRVSFDGSDWVLKVPVDGVKQSLCVDDIELFRGVCKVGGLAIEGAYCYRDGRDYIIDGGVEFEVVKVECKVVDGGWVPLSLR